MSIFRGLGARSAARAAAATGRSAAGYSPPAGLPDPPVGWPYPAAAETGWPRGSVPNTRHPGWPTDPPTDPVGHPVGITVGPVLPPHPAAAAALAAAFAADYLSWDEAEPARRGQALARYLSADATVDPARLGWSGHGRQRTEFALPGLTWPDGDRIMVDVRVRVTPYQRVASPPGSPDPRNGAARTPAALPPGGAGMAAAAPAPDAPGWRSLGSLWVRLAVPVALDGDLLVVDTTDEW